jgi:hypothetical protein
MQFDYIDWFGKNIIYFILALGAIILLYLVRAFFVRSQYRDMQDSDKLESPTYEEIDSGIKISIDDEDDP